MKIDVSTVLNCSVATAWEEVQRSSLLLHVSWPLARVVPIGGLLPERWTEGLTIRCRPFVLGVPIGVRTLHFERVDQTNHEIQTRERDPLITRWDHLITIKPLGITRSVYRDTIVIDAGILTFAVWIWANWLYRHRQGRWRALARSL